MLYIRDIETDDKKNAMTRNFDTTKKTTIIDKQILISALIGDVFNVHLSSFLVLSIVTIVYEYSCYDVANKVQLINITINIY